MKAWSIFSKKSFTAAPQSPAVSAQRQLSSSNSLRRELVSVALRSTLLKHGIPMGWMSIEIQSALNSKGELYSHVRLLLKHWEPQFLQYMVALQNSLQKRIFLLDATAHAWLRSIGWQFSLPDESVCPAMPPSLAWTSVIKIPEVKPEPVQEETPVISVMLTPVRESTLDKLLRTMDDRGRQYGVADFQNTEPFDHAGSESRH